MTKSADTPFEFWATSKQYDIRKYPDGRYFSHTTQTAKDGWDASGRDDLLEALEAYVNPEIKMEPGKRGDKARAAIAKARGEA